MEKFFIKKGIDKFKTISGQLPNPWKFIPNVSLYIERKRDVNQKNSRNFTNIITLLFNEYNVV